MAAHARATKSRPASPPPPAPRPEQVAPTRSTESKQVFRVGDKAVYPAHGVGVIESIETKDIAGSRLKFYMLRILENDMTIMIPTHNVESVGLRGVIDKKMVVKIYKILREQDLRIDTQTWNRRYREYTEKIKTGSVLEIAEVLRDLCVLKRKKKDLSFGERKMLDTARNLLVKEIAIAKGMKEPDVLADLDRVLGEPKASRSRAKTEPAGPSNGNGNGGPSKSKKS